LIGTGQCSLETKHSGDGMMAYLQAPSPKPAATSNHAVNLDPQAYPAFEEEPLE
jgi:hypothetical protein